MKFFLKALCLFILPTDSAFAQLTLDVVYPREGLTLTAKDSTFIFGSTNSADARVIVNGLPMSVYSNGAFLGVVPVTAGEFVFESRAFTAYDSAAVRIKVFVSPYLVTTPRDSAAIDSSYVFPNSDIELQPGDFLHVAFKATPGHQAFFSIPGLIANAPMAEGLPWKEFYWGEAVFGADRPPVTPDIAGVYHGMVRIGKDVELDSGRIEFKLNGTNGSDLSIVAPGFLTVRNDRVPRIGTLTSELTVARTEAGLGYHMFLQAGVKLWVTGRKAGYYRARVATDQHVWVPEASLELLPPGTPIPSSPVKLVRTKSLPDRAQVKIFLQERLPFKVEQKSNPSALIISVFGAFSGTDWIRHDFGDPSIRQVSWSQPKDGVYQVTVELKHRQQWGYDPYYDDTNLVVDIKRPPRKLSLKEMLICVDPGHGPDDGAVGPTRLTERDANLQLALVLKSRLEKKGAKVFLTRSDSHGAALAVRPKMAALMDADLLLSIHHNALPDGVNPFASRGTSTYYYHPQSQPLAAAIQKRLLEKLKLNNFGLYYDNLALCRPPQMPAVLIESAFIMHPEEEMLIGTYKYRQKAAEAIIKGIEDFLKASKE